MPEYEAWRENLKDSGSSWSINYYKGLGTSTSKEGREYFQNLDKHKKYFVWKDKQDREAIGLAFSKKIQERKNWLRRFKPGTQLDQKQKVVKYSDFIHTELILFSLANLQRSSPSMVGLKPGKGRFFSTLSRGTLSRKQRLPRFLVVCQSIKGGKDHASACYIYTKLYHVTRFFFPKDDDILLDYLNEDGQKIEPTWYMPIIPTVLVNGSKGIGTG